MPRVDPLRLNSFEKNMQELMLSNSITGDWLASMFKRSLGLGDPSPPEDKILTEPNLDAIIEYIKSGKCKNIVTMAGAGISTCKLSSCL